MKIRNREEGQKNALNMTSMIDIVFLLLVFFVMTFKIVELEGDFSVRMPLAGSDSVTMDPTDLPLKLRLMADENGRLTSMLLNEIDLGTDFDQLRSNNPPPADAWDLVTARQRAARVVGSPANRFDRCGQQASLPPADGDTVPGCERRSRNCRGAGSRLIGVVWQT